MRRNEGGVVQRTGELANPFATRDRVVDGSSRRPQHVAAEHAGRRPELKVPRGQGRQLEAGGLGLRECECAPPPSTHVIDRHHYSIENHTHLGCTNH